MRGFCCIGLHNPKFTQNIGTVIRSCGNYNVDMIAISGTRYKHQCSDTQKVFKHTPLLQVSNLHDVIPFDCVPVAVDMIDGAHSIINYVHPERAFYIFGAEDETLGRTITDYCRDVIYIPTNHCLNLSVAVSTVLYDRIAKGINRKL